LGRREQGDRLVGKGLGALLEAEAADVFVAAGLPATARVRVAPALVLVAVDRIRLDSRADVGRDLLGQTAIRRCEGLPLALGRVAGLREGDSLDACCRLIGSEQLGDLGLERDLERVLVQGWRVAGRPDGSGFGAR
jgi:hypothetical protein